MAKQKKNGFKVGEIVWIPCQVKEGMFPTERYIHVDIKGDKAPAISGFIPSEDVKKSTGYTGKVRAVISELLRDNAYLLFRGEILSRTNPVSVPAKWLTEAV